MDTSGNLQILLEEISGNEDENRNLNYKKGLDNDKSKNYKMHAVRLEAIQVRGNQREADKWKKLSQ